MILSEAEFGTAELVPQVEAELKLPVSILSHLFAVTVYE
jgi:hypothetical protein